MILDPSSSVNILADDFGIYFGDAPVNLVFTHAKSSLRSGPAKKSPSRRSQIRTPSSSRSQTPAPSSCSSTSSGFCERLNRPLIQRLSRFKNYAASKPRHGFKLHLLLLRRSLFRSLFLLLLGFRPQVMKGSLHREEGSVLRFQLRSSAGTFLRQSSLFAVLLPHLLGEYL